ncbi:hypothetical protein [Asticcacaulis solisilvae]|uniref:hypothetical protein n=1 Tax=Asticcacaulis solisilvae TaxID=1217274 RepID=UPI003FD86874
MLTAAMMLALQMTPVLPDKLPVKPDLRPAPAAFTAPSTAVRLYTAERTGVTVPAASANSPAIYSNDPRPLTVTVSVPSRLLILTTVAAEVKLCATPTACGHGIWISPHLAVKHAGRPDDVFADNPGSVGGELSQVFKSVRPDDEDGKLTPTSGFATAGTFQSVTQVLQPGQYDVTVTLANTRGGTVSADVMAQKTVQVIPDQP